MHRLLERASRPRGDVRPQGSCLDAETLAAWTDGSLTGAARTAAETHAADCDRCLAVLAAIAKTAPPPSSAARPAWLSVRWLVPLTTAAVAITAWVIVQEPPRPVVPAAPAAVDVLKAPDPAAPPEQDVAEAKRPDAVQHKTDASAAPKALADQARAGRAAEPAEKRAAAPVPQVARPTEAPAAAAPAPPPAARAEAQQERRQSAARFALAPNGVIVSPDPNVRWRLLGTTVERSIDSGRTWQAQPTGTTLELLAGAAPAPDVAWIVGRSGLVLLSTDGETWRRLPFPDPAADLVGITAPDAASATVTAADGRTYRTTDGGKSWFLQESFAAPF